MESQGNRTLDLRIGIPTLYTIHNTTLYIKAVLELLLIEQYRNHIFIKYHVQLKLELSTSSMYLLSHHNQSIDNNFFIVLHYSPVVKGILSPETILTYILYFDPLNMMVTFFIPKMSLSSQKTSLNTNI